MQFHFENHVLDTDRRELRRGSELIAVEPQVFDLLLYLVQNRDRVVTKDDLIAAVWGGRIVSESTLTSRINAVRKAVGDSGDEQRLIRTIARKGIRFVGEVSETAGATRNGRERADPPPRRRRLHQEVHFCTATDGVRIAYAEVGNGTATGQDRPTGSPTSSTTGRARSGVHFLHEMAAERRLIRYDARGNGLSDWEVDEISFEAFVRDLESVVEATGLDEFDLLGMSQGCAISVAYAVRHPERVSHLVLYGGFARGRRKRGSQQEIDAGRRDRDADAPGLGPGKPGIPADVHIAVHARRHRRADAVVQRPAAHHNFAGQCGAHCGTRWTSSTSPTCCRSVQSPTLVLHCRDDAVQPFEEGRRLAAGIPGARFVTLEGRNHVILPGDASWERFFEEVNAFLSS